MILRPLMLLAMLLLAGCATKSTIEKRRLERAGAYETLTAEEKFAVDKGEMKVGMSLDAVYIALGKPDSVSEKSVGSDRFATWRYWGRYMQVNHYMTYDSQTSRLVGGSVLSPTMATDRTLRDYVRAEIDFENGKAVTWRFYSQPTQ